MATPNLTPKLYGVSDLRIYQMLTDDLNSVPTYDPVGIKMPGVSAVSISNETKMIEGKGDERILELEAQDDSSKISFDLLYVPLQAMMMVNGGVLDTTTDTNAATYFGPSPTDVGNYFKIEALTKPRMEKLIIYKVKGRLYPDGLKGGQFEGPAFVGESIHTTGMIAGDCRRFALVQANYKLVLGGAAQAETATVVGTITTAGNATVTVTAAGMTGSPKAVTVAVAVNDSAAVVAEKIREALVADPNVSAFFTVSGAGAAVVLTAKTAAANDATMNVAIANGTCVGLTAAPTSTNTVIGQAPV